MELQPWGLPTSADHVWHATCPKRRVLERDGLVSRQIYPTVPPRAAWDASAH
jgi:hypothetical protein